jgi:hypothetical protein
LLQETSENKRQSARQALLRYCERDTAALVRMVNTFYQQGDFYERSSGEEYYKKEFTEYSV